MRPFASSTRLFLAALTFALFTSQAQAATVVVKPSNMNGWVFYDDATNTLGGTGSFAAGPATPPAGTGSVRLGPLTTDGGTTGISAIATGAYANVALSTINAMSFSSYQTSSGGTRSASLQFDILYQSTDTAYAGRLVFEPVNDPAQGPVVDGAWQNWNALAATAKWWATNNGPTGSNGNCTQASPCTWAQVNSLFPTAKVNVGLYLRTGSTAGGGWIGFDGYADALTIGVGATSDTFNFENDCTTVCFVNAATGNDANSGAAATSAKLTIQAAVSQVNASGTVNVAAGTYVEDVTISTPLSLLGAGIGVSTISGAIGGPGSTISVGAGGVLIDGFTITRQGNSAATWNNPGLNTAGVSIQSQGNNAEIRNSRFFGNRTGIDINDSNGNNVHNNVIEFNRTGLIFRNQTDNTTFSENFVRDNFTVGLLFLDGSGGSNIPVQSAASSNFSNNSFSGNWYGQIVDRQAGGSLPAPGGILKNFINNWYGTTTPSVSTADSTEPGYAAQIPVMFGGTAVPPAPQPQILGPASANFVYIPFRTNGIDTNIETSPGRGTIGYQPDNSVISISDASLTEGDGAGLNMAFTVTRTGGTAAVTFKYSTVAGTAASPSDYVGATNASATIAANGTGTTTINIVIGGDSVYEGVSENFTVVLSNPVGGTIADGTGVGTIIDNDPVPTIAINDRTVSEAATGVGFTVARTGATKFPITFTCTTAGTGPSPATPGADYSVPLCNGATVITIPPASANVTIPFSVVADAIDENNETFEVVLGSVTDANVADGIAAGSITDNNSTPNIQFKAINNPTVTEGTGGGTTPVTFTASLSAASGLPVSASASTEDGTAKVGSPQLDYVAAVCNFSWAPGDATDKTCVVSVNQDSKDEVNETFGLRFTGTTNATVGGSGLATATITNDDAPPTVSIAPASVNEGVNAIFAITLSAASGKAVTVNALTNSVTATAGTDFTNPGNLLISFAEGETAKTYTVPTLADSNIEPNETFNVVLGSPSNTTISGPSTVAGTIQEASPALLANVSNVSAPETNADQTYTFNVTLSGAHYQTVTVNAATADGAPGFNQATQPSDYTQKAALVTFTPGQTTKTFTVTVKGDAIAEGDDRFFVALSNPLVNGGTSATVVLGPSAQGTGTIRNDDAGGVTTGLIISEFRLRGPNGIEDEFVEVANKTNSPIFVSTVAPSTGFAVAKSNGTVLFTIPNGYTIPVGGRFLGVNSNGYSLSAYATSDAQWTGDDDEVATPGLGLFSSSVTLDNTTKMDGVGFTGAGADYSEGTALTPAYDLPGQYSHVRKMPGGFIKDTGDNTADFLFVATLEGSLPNRYLSTGGPTPVHGSPGPENLAGPRDSNADVSTALIDSGATATQVPNREFVAGPCTTPTCPRTYPGGVLTIRRALTNNSGSPITQLRFRVVEMTTLNGPTIFSPQADERWITSSAETGVVLANLSTVNTEGVTIELADPVEGGGYNASGAVGSITLGTPLANGATVNVNFRLAFETVSSFRFLINIEAVK